MKRSVSIFLNRLLDDFAPPIIRDSRWFYLPLLRLGMGAQNARIIDGFKDQASGMSEKEFADLYTKADSPKRETDLNGKCAQRLLAETAGKTVLEVGCGKGWLAGKLAQKNKVTAVDIIIKEETRRCPDVGFQQANAESLPFPDKSFDVVVVAHTLEHVRNFGKTASELRRVCRERLIVVVPCQRPYNYTPDLHLHFFPYPHSLVNALYPQPGACKCEKEGGDLYYTEWQSEAAPESQLAEKSKSVGNRPGDAAREPGAPQPPPQTHHE